MQESGKRMGQSALHNGLVLGHTKYNGVQRELAPSDAARTLKVSGERSYGAALPMGVGPSESSIQDDSRYDDVGAVGWV